MSHFYQCREPRPVACEEVGSDSMAESGVRLAFRSSIAPNPATNNWVSAQL